MESLKPRLVPLLALGRAGTAGRRERPLGLVRKAAGSSLLDKG